MTHNRKILVVDDDADILAVMELLFKTKGYDVAAISKGDEVFTTIKTFQPNLILLDVLISGEDGRDICRQLKENQQTQHIPVVMFSANAGAEQMISEYGADDFIHKPFDVTDLLERIEAHLKKSASLSSN